MCMLLTTHSVQWEMAISAPPGSKSWIREVHALKLTRLPTMPDLVENARRIVQKKKWRNLLFSGACYTWNSISNCPGRSSSSFTWQNGHLLPGCELSQPWPIWIHVWHPSCPIPACWGHVCAPRPTQTDLFAALSSLFFMKGDTRGYRGTHFHGTSWGTMPSTQLIGHS